jgi:hypothetical protein
MQKQHDFVFGLNIPINVPTQEEIESVRNNLEDNFARLIETEYMTIEETVAYVKFATNLAAFVPFTLDGFLESYRSNMLKLREQNPQEPER